MTVGAGRGSKDWSSLATTAAVRHKYWVSRRRRMVDHPGTVVRPVKLRDAFQVQRGLAPQNWRRPDTDAGFPAIPKCDDRVVRGKSQGADFRIDDVCGAAPAQVVKLSGADLR